MNDRQPPHNYRRLAKQAGVASFQDDAASLLDLARDYIAAAQRKFRDEDDPVGERRRRLRQLLRLSKQAEKLEANLTHLQLKMHDDAPTHHLTDREWPRYVLSIYVELFEDIWREHGGRGEFTAYNKYDKKHDGPLIWLLGELFEQTSAPAEFRPSAHTVYRARQDAKKRREQEQREAQQHVPTQTARPRRRSARGLRTRRPA